MKRIMVDGNGAATEALRLARVQVIAAYPITPQSPISEKLSEYVASGELNAKYIRVESEHSAMSCCIGAQLTGARAGTATSSVGLALMHEVLGVAAGCRVPIVMPVVNRALVSPWSLWCDHQDTMAERDTGWLQFYAENAQEVLDLTLMAYRISEDERVLLPAMICLDGFFLSHMTDAIYIPEQSDVDEFLPAYVPSNFYLDPANPMFINDLTSPAEFTEMRYQQFEAFSDSEYIINEIFEEYNKKFGKNYSMIEAYKCDDADAVVVTLGSMSGTAKHTVDELRNEGKKVGMLKITSFRPFPVQLIKDALKNVKVVGVLDRSISLGGESGAVCSEIRAALLKYDSEKIIKGFVGGLGGRDVPVASFAKIFDRLLSEDVELDTEWIDVKENAFLIREVV